MLPLLAMSTVALLEASVIVVLLLRGDRSTQPVALAPVATTSNQSSPSPASQANPATTPTAPHGKVGERVASGGFGITVEKILREPQTYKDQVTIGPDQRYIALRLRIDNDTGHNAQLFPSQFVLKDDQGFTYDPLGIHGTMPALEWRALANRETVRGYVDFLCPKTAAGLVLTYGDTSQVKEGQPIQIDLGQ
jgi:hypothetical protein